MATETLVKSAERKAKVSRREPLWCVAFLLTAALLLHVCGNNLRPAHTDYGSTWQAYLAEPKDSIDVLFLGSSYAYCDWNPAVMYAESGLTGYAGPRHHLLVLKRGPPDPKPLGGGDGGYQSVF